MTKDDKYSLLIDLAEGTLSESRRREAEEILRTSPEMADDLRLLTSALGALGQSSAEPAPDHYFSTIVPRIRQRIESGYSVSSLSLPRFLESLFAPALVAAVVFTIVGMYQAFRPELPARPIYTIVAGIEQEEIDIVLEEMSDLAAEGSPFRSSGSIATVDPLFTADLLAQEIGMVQNEQELIARLESSEIELVFDRLGIHNLP